jgi:hypothetical protein
VTEVLRRTEPFTAAEMAARRIEIIAAIKDVNQARATWDEMKEKAFQAQALYMDAMKRVRELRSELFEGVLAGIDEDPWYRDND